MIRGPVLVATDLSEPADAALRQGHDIASSLDAQLLIGHVLPEAFRARVLFPHAAGIDTVAQREIEEKAIAAVRLHAGSVLGVDGQALSIEILAGTTHAGILEMAERIDAGIIVLGPGPTALRVARSAAVPVLIARPSPAGGSVLGATDFSDPSLPAVNLAAAEASRRACPLRLIHCLNLDWTTMASSAILANAVALPPIPPTLVEEIEAAARERLLAAMNTTGVSGEAAVTLGPAKAGILAAVNAVPTALVVVGTRGRTGLPRLALGSTG